MNTQQTLDAILTAIYWKNFTPKQEKVITEIINDVDMSSISKANEICELLGIERRGNRYAISQIL